MREGFASRPDRVEAYRVLVEMAENFEESLKCIEEARGQSLAAGQSCAIWDLMELSVRFGQGDVHEAMRLMQHIESRHMKEPGVAQSLTRMLINAGLLNPDGTPVAVPPGYPGGESVPAAPEPSKLWTPGSESSGSGGGKLGHPARESGPCLVAYRYGCPSAVHPLPAVLELALPGKFLPNGRAELVGRHDGHDRRVVAAAHRTAADPRLIVQLRQLEPLAKCLQGRLEFLRRWDRGRVAICGRHGSLLWSAATCRRFS